MGLIRQLSYLIIESAKTEDWKTYATDFLGMNVPAEQPGEYLRIRMDERAYRFLVKPAAADTASEDIWAAGFQVANAQALRALEDHLVTQGIEVHHATTAELAERDAADMIWLHDPEGLRIEVSHTPRSYTEPLALPLIPGGFMTGDMGFGHIAISAIDLPACEAFYREVLGFQLSDYIEQDIQGIPIKFTFLHVNPRHHTLALAGVPTPYRLNHIMVEVHDVDTVGRALERSKQLGINLYMNIGRHPNDQMLSFYANTPSQFAIEVGVEGVQIHDDTNWEVKTYDAISSWGHKD